MAFEDSNDIKISVTLDADNAIKQADALKKSIEQSFASLAKQIKSVNSALKSLDTSGLAALQAVFAKEIEELKANNKLKVDLRKAELADQRKRALDEAKIERDRTEQLRKQSRDRIALELEENRQRNRIQIAKIRTDEAIRGAEAKAAIRNQGGGDTGFLGAATNQLRKFAQPITSAAASVYLLKEAFNALTAPIRVLDQINQGIDQLALSANKLQGLKTGFETLQRGLGSDPSVSIEKLRTATQGLVSDVDLYQRANQAVLLGVPTETFNEAAAAAVKLGRAMGIDAAFGLESLSLGLGRQSRLYLDNLGIVVSAEEAYKNFALANGIVGRELTDSEKKAAFYAEALKKIKERADELPNPLDDVGTSIQKLGVAQSNANKAFQEGFNSSQELVKAYQKQAELQKQLEANNQKAGVIYGGLAAIFKSASNDITQEYIKTRDAAINLIDRFADLTPEEELVTLKQKIADTEAELKTLGQQYVDAGGKNGYLELKIQRLQETLQSYQLTLLATEDRIKALRDQSEKEIKLKFDLSEVQAAQSAFNNLFANLQKDILQDSGKFEVPGLSESTVKSAGAGIEELAFQLNQGTINSDRFKDSLGEIKKDVGIDAVGKAAEDTARKISLINSQVEAGRKGREEANQEILQLTVAQKELADAAGFTTEQEKEFAAFAKNAAKQGKKRSDDLIAETKRQSKAQGDAIRRTEQEFNQFVKGIKRSIGTAIPESFQKELVGLFKDSTLSADEFEKKLIDLGKRAQKAGVDIGAIKKEAEGLQQIGSEIGFPNLGKNVEDSKKIAENIEKIKQIQSTMPNLNKLLFGTESGQGGGFFGFDLGNSLFGGEISAEAEAQLANQLQQSIGSALQMAVDGVNRDNAPEIGAAIGAGIGAAITTAIYGDPTSGAIIGSFLGQAIGDAIANLGKDTDATRQKKDIDKYFAEIFDGDRLAVVIEGEVATATAALSVLPSAMADVNAEMTQTIEPTLVRINDLVFSGFTRFAGNVRFGIEEIKDGYNSFSSFFNTLPATVQNTFTGIGVAFGSLLGVAEEQSVLIGTAIANNIGGSLQNLQVLVQQTGESFDDLASSILDSFLSSRLSIEEAYNALAQLEQLYAVGIPGAVGAYQEAIDNLNNSLQSDAPGRYATDSLRDIGAEALEAGKTFDFAISQLGATFKFTAEQQTRLFEAFKIAGITSLQQLQAASDAQLLTILRNIQAIQQNAQAPLGGVPQTSFSAPRSSSGGSKKETPEQRLRRQAGEQTNDLIKIDKAYLAILDQVKAGSLSNAQASAQISARRKEIFDQVQKLLFAEYKLDQILSKEPKDRTAQERRRIPIYAERIRQLTEAIDELKKKQEEQGYQTKQLNLSAVIPLITNMNMLGVVARQTGVDLQKNVDILVQGFLAGKLSIEEVNKQINKTKDLLGPGIPGAIGDVKNAFQNLIDAGEQGGAFSADAFVDIFAEFREKFQKESGALRETQRRALTANVDTARRAFEAAGDPTAAAAAAKKLNEAKAALEAFNNSVDAPNLTDLREELLKTFSGDYVDKFFQALDQSGIRGFEEFEKAGNQSIIEILGKLKEVGFQFNQTSGDIQGVNQGLNDAAKNANAGLDPLAQAVSLVQSFNNGASTLPPALNSTTQAIEGMNGPLSRLQAGFADIQTKLSLLSGQTYNTTVVFDVKTTGDENGKTLLELLFGKGDGAASDTGGRGGGAENTNTARRTELQNQISGFTQQLNRLKRQRKTNTSEYRRIQAKLKKAQEDLEFL